MCHPCLQYVTRNEVSANSKQQSYVHVYPYAEKVGLLLSRAVGVLTRHLKSLTYSSCKAACRVHYYLSHYPVTVCITYSGRKLDLHVYTDLHVFRV